MSRRQSLHPDDEGEARQGMQDMHEAPHSLPLVSGGKNEIQEDRDLSDLRQAEEHLPDVPPRPGVRPARPGQGRGTQDQG